MVSPPMTPYEGGGGAWVYPKHEWHNKIPESKKIKEEIDFE